MATGIIQYLDGQRDSFHIAECRMGERILLTVGEPLDYEKIAYLDFDTGLSHAKIGEDGFYLLIVSDTDTALRTAEMAVCHMDGTMIYQLEVKKAVPHAGGELYAAE